MSQRIAASFQTKIILTWWHIVPPTGFCIWYGGQNLLPRWSTSIPTLGDLAINSHYNWFVNYICNWSGTCRVQLQLLHFCYDSWQLNVQIQRYYVPTVVSSNTTFLPDNDGLNLGLKIYLHSLSYNILFVGGITFEVLVLVEIE